LIRPPIEFPVGSGDHSNPANLLLTTATGPEDWGPFALTAQTHNVGVTSPIMDALIAEGEAEPVEGWDFSWLEGRATEERPSWGYARMLISRVASASSVLDIQTGGGEVFAEVLGHTDGLPCLLAATESWPPNAERARRNLAPFGLSVAEVSDDGELPFPNGTFDLVVSRHPTLTVWDEIARVLRPGGSYFSQQVGAGTNRELTDFMMGPQPVSEGRSTDRAVSRARQAGLEIVDLREETLRVEFYDVGAVVYFLRKVLWTVPGFSADAYKDQLAALHELIAQEGAFISYSRRFLVEAKKMP
jgi:SAM-dependent methyltransferase